MKNLSVLSALIVLSAFPVMSFADAQSSCAPQTYKFGEKAGTRAAVYTADSSKATSTTHKTGECVVDVPKGLVGNDLADFNHLSEGSDVYPYEWFMALKSITFADSDGKNTAPFAMHLDRNFGFMRTDGLDSVKMVNGKPRKIKYLVPYVGLTASWSSQRTDNSRVEQFNDVSQSADAFAAYETADGKMVKESQIIKELVDVNNNTVKSIRMVGTNCSLCHSGVISYSPGMHGGSHDSKEFRIQGAPGVVNMRAFFRDLIASTVIMFVKGDYMKEFLTEIKRQNPSLSHINPKKDAAEVKEYFCKEVAASSKDMPGLISQVLAKGKISCNAGKLFTFLKATKLGDRQRLYNARDAVKRSFELLVRKTYNIPANAKLGNLEHQIRYMSIMGTGMKPPMEETIPGFARTDAFGRISNLVLRGEFPVDNTAPVSLPWIWGLKYMGNLHYNGNSNSVILRNVGQALGLGAVITSDKLDTNVNVHNLDRLEHLVHKIKVPEWNETFKSVLNKNDESYLEEFEIDSSESRLKAGYNLYKTNCMGCHESNKFVGPAGSLREYSMYPLSNKNVVYGNKPSPNTDPHAAQNAVKPIKVLNKATNQMENIAFDVKIFDDVSGIKARYYNTYGIPPNKQAEMEFRDLRGNEFFRDTLLGSATNKKGNSYGQIEAGNGYKARHLSGVWSTAPFLHNGSVPTMMLLLTQDSERPKYFNVESNEFDPINMGLKNWVRTGDRPCDKEDSTEEHICFATTEKGNSNVGHNWGTQLSTQEKFDLINFLKYLPPEPEYSWETQSQY